jgi:hypothetical protein
MRGWMAAGGSAAAATGATASPRRLPWHHAGRCFGGEPAHWWVNTVVDHFADMVPCSCRVLDLIKQHSRGWRRDRLKPFPELRFTYEEGALQLHPSMHACMLGLPACTACMHACMQVLAWQACLCERGNLGATLPACSAGQSNAAPACAVSQPAPHAMWLGRPLSQSRHCRCGGLIPLSCNTFTHPPAGWPTCPALQRRAQKSSLCPMCGALRWRRQASPGGSPPSPSLPPQVRPNSACACLRCTSPAGDTVQCLCMSALRCTYWRPTMCGVP